MTLLHRLRERLQGKHAPTLLLVTAGSALLMLMIMLLAVVMPQARERDAEESVRQKLQQEVDGLRVEATARNGATEQEELAARLPAGLDLAGMLDEMMELADAADVQLQEIRQNRPDVQLEGASTTQEAAVEITLSGSLSGLLQMLNYIQESERLYAVKWWNYRQLTSGEADVPAFKRGAAAPGSTDAVTGLATASPSAITRYAMTLLVIGYGRPGADPAYDHEAARAALAERFPELHRGG